MQHDTAPNESAESARVYEAGLLLVPSIAPEQIESVFGKIKTAIEKANGTIISEEIPTLRTLAYTMSKDITGRKLKYSTAYFGWVKFEGTSEISKIVDTDLKESENVLRYLIIKTVRENTLYSQKQALAKAEAEKDATEGVLVDGGSEQEIDKGIEKLLV